MPIYMVLQPSTFDGHSQHPEGISGNLHEHVDVAKRGLSVVETYQISTKVRWNLQ